MDQRRARELLDGERRRLDALEEQSRQDRDGAIQAMSSDPGWIQESPEYTGELLQAGALEELLQRRRQALAEAEQRLGDGSYGRSVLSGEPIPDERLEADPLATLTAAEAEPVRNPIEERQRGTLH